MSTEKSIWSLQKEDSNKAVSCSWTQSISAHPSQKGSDTKSKGSSNITGSIKKSVFGNYQTDQYVFYTGIWKSNSNIVICRIKVQTDVSIVSGSICATDKYTQPMNQSATDSPSFWKIPSLRNLEVCRISFWRQRVIDPTDELVKKTQTKTSYRAATKIK